MSHDLGKLYFGRDDAEMDIAEGGLLHVGFLRTAVYEQVRMARKNLIIGRKGSGKSAICRTLAASGDQGPATVLVTPDQLSADEIQRFELQGVPVAMAKGMLWRYKMTVEVAKYLVAHAKAAHAKNRPSSVDVLHEFLVANHELDKEESRFWEIIRKLKVTLSLGMFGAKASVEIGGPSEGIRVNNQLDVIERHVGKAITDLDCPDDHPRLLILIDQVEDVWSDDADSDKLVIGLLDASREIPGKFRGVQCVVFLRGDIFDVLRFSDSDKHHSASTHISWMGEALLDMVLARARASLGEQVSADDLWTKIFPRQVNGIDSREFIISHTLRRPRDIIHLCNLCRDVAEQNGHRTIQVSDVVESVAQYSTWKLTDLANEYLINYPFLNRLLAMFKNSGYVVGRGAFEKRFAPALDEIRTRHPDRANALTTDGVLDVLYTIGFLGTHRNGRVVYAHEQKLTDRIEPTDTAFSIHPSFRYALHAESPTAVLPPEFDLPVPFDSPHAQSAPNLFLRRGSTPYTLWDSVGRRLRRVLENLADAGLPTEVRDDIIDNVHEILHFVDTTDPRIDPVAVFKHVMNVSAFLVGLSEKLEEDGFADQGEARTFIRSMADTGARLRREAVGTDEYR
jgi:hypothetical protein